MRLLPAVFAALVCASAASAQEKPLETAPAPVAAAVAAAAPDAQNAPQPALAKPAHRTRLTWEQRFAQANTTNDGHLTLEQAKAGYATVARHFQDIDLDSKGYVTKDDVRAWHKVQGHAKAFGPPLNLHLGVGRDTILDRHRNGTHIQRQLPRHIQLRFRADRHIEWLIKIEVFTRDLKTHDQNSGTGRGRLPLGSGGFGFRLQKIQIQIENTGAGFGSGISLM